MAEIHTLGSPPLLEAVVRALCRAGARLAEPGEFTLRAFLSGRIDLTEAEAVLGVVDAGDCEELAVALEQLAGGLARPLQELRSRLFDLLVHLEAGLDFPEEDLPFLSRQDLARQLQEAYEKVQSLAEQIQSRRIVSEGVTVVLVGRPNAGKSSLFNALLSQTHAIVSPCPGTTRDYLTGSLDLEGVRCRLVDTAGLDWVGLEAQLREKTGEETPRDVGPGGVRDNVPQESWRNNEEDVGEVFSMESSVRQMTMAQLQRADVYVWCVDASQPIDAQELAQLALRGSVPYLVVLTKGDLPVRTNVEALAAQLSHHPILTSSLTGQGLEELRARLREEILGLFRSSSQGVLATALRSGESIRLAAHALERALECASQAGSEELIATEIRLALDELGKVSGTVYTEDLLERIFSRFCIGK